MEFPPSWVVVSHEAADEAKIQGFVSPSDAPQQINVPGILIFLAEATDRSQKCPTEETGSIEV